MVRLGFILAVVIPGLLSAQSTDMHPAAIAASQLGKTIRIRTDSGPTIVGSLQRVQAETLFVMTSRGETEPVGSTRVTRIDVREPLSAHEQRRNGWIGLGVGLVGGVAVGHAIAVSSARREQQRQGGPFEGVDQIIDPIAGGFVGSVIGTAIGFARSERWIRRYP